MNFFQSQPDTVSKRHHFVPIVILLLLAAVLPVLIWAVTTQRIELRQFAVSPTPTPTETPTPTLTPTPAPTLTPTPIGAKNTYPICASMYTDISSGVSIPLTVTFVCTGVDTDGYVNGVEFTFGDGAKELIEQNIGGVGSITTKHTYTTIGTLGASCRVRDNNNVFSSTPIICKKNITIKPAPTAKATPKPEQEKGAVLTTPFPLATTSTSSAEASPSPTVILTPYEQPQPTPKDNTRTLWIAGGVVGLVLAFFLLRRRPPGAPPAQTIPPINPPTDVSMPPNIPE